MSARHSVPCVDAERERAAAAAGSGGRIHGHVAAERAAAAVEPGEVDGVGAERAHAVPVEQQPGPLLAALRGGRLAAAGRELAVRRVAVADEAVQPVAVADDLEEEGEHLLGPELGLLHAAPHGGHPVVDGALLLLEAHHLRRHHGHVFRGELGGAGERGGVLPLAAAAASRGAAAAADDVAQEVGLAAQERRVRELPPVRINLAEALRTRTEGVCTVQIHQLYPLPTDEEQKMLVCTRSNQFIAWSDFTDIGVELAHEAGEVVVLEVRGEQRLREDEGVGDDEAVVPPSPSDDPVRPGVLHHHVRLPHERRRRAAARRHPRFLRLLI
uniref:Uncharacterized protein n=1 Tax=Setaria italica TaxID=4555 RepID=K3XY74_SETIT